MKKLLHNKRGSIIDIAFVLVAVLGLGIVLLIAAYVFPQITHGLSNSTSIGNNTASMAALDYTDKLTTRFDMIFLVIFVGLCISVLITSFLIDSNPIFMPIYIIALGLLIIFSVVCEHVYDEFVTNATFSAITATHPITTYILTHMVIATIGLGVLSMILIFAKPRGGGVSTPM